MRKLFKERKLFKGGNYMRKYGILLILEPFLEAIPQVVIALVYQYHIALTHYPDQYSGKI